MVSDIDDIEPSEKLKISMIKVTTARQIKAVVTNLQGGIPMMMQSVQEILYGVCMDASGTLHEYAH